MQTQRKPWPRKRKAAALMVAVLSAILLTGGTYAITQSTVANQPTYAVLLHDDASNENRDIYVENTGQTAVYVRVKFAEYLQINSQAMLTEYSGTDAADPNDVKTWTVHTWTDANTTATTTTVTNVDTGVDTTVTTLTTTGATADGTTYYTWTLGNAATGTKDYVAGIADGESRGGAAFEAEFESMAIGQTFLFADVATQKAQTLAGADPILMEDYLTILKKAKDTRTSDEQAKVDTPRWVLDTDGWAYWSQPLEAGTATALLLDKIEQTNAPSGSWSYNIDVQLQAVTVEELSTWFTDNETDAKPTDDPQFVFTTADANKVANPNNTYKTATSQAYQFLLWTVNRAMNEKGIIAASVKNVDGSADNTYLYTDGNNVYVQLEYAASAFAYRATGKVIVAGYDQEPETNPASNINVETDNDYLAGRSGGIAVAAVYLAADDPMAEYVNPEGERLVEEAYYTIQGADEGYYVVAGKDGLLGTWDDVIRDAKTTTVEKTDSSGVTTITTQLVGRLGIYNYDVDNYAENISTDATKDKAKEEVANLNGKSVGWYYLKGTVEDMLVLCEASAGKTGFSYSTSTTTATWRYTEDALISVCLKDYYTRLEGSRAAIITTKTIETTEPYDAGYRYYGIMVCTVTDHNTVVSTNNHEYTYHSKNADDSCNANTTTYVYCARSSSFGTIKTNDIFFPLSMQEVIEAYCTQMGTETEAMEVGINAPIGSVQSFMWLRTPGITTARGSVVSYSNHRIYATGICFTRSIVNTDNSGEAVAACYLDLTGKVDHSQTATP